MMDLDRAGFVFLGDEDWDGVWRRSQHLVGQLASRLPEARFLFVERCLDLPRRLRNRQFSLDGVSPTRRVPVPVPGLDNVFTIRPLEWLPQVIAVATELSSGLQAREIRRAMERLLPRNPYAWVQNPNMADVALRLPVGHLIYDLTDDWPEAELFGPRERARLRHLDKRLADASSAIIACSQDLINTRSAGAGRVHLVKNGVDLPAYREATLMPVRRGSVPTIGYVGTLHDERLDPEIIGAVAARMPATAITLVGPDHLSPHLRGRLVSLSNVRVEPPVDHSEVPALLASFDVCILPHRVTPFTNSLDPLKFLEYMAARRPIVSSAVASARQLGAFMDVAYSPQQFADFTAKALLSVDTARLAAARAFAAQNSWTARGDQIVAILRGLGVAGTLAHGQTRNPSSAL